MLIRMVGNFALVSAMALFFVGCGGGGGSSGSNSNRYFLGGSIAGLTASGLILKSSDQTVSPQAGETVFEFPNQLASGTNYSVEVSANPIGLKCQVSNASGTVASSDITSVTIDCHSLEQVLHSFGSGTTWGAQPYDVLTLGRDGNFYGLTRNGGSLNQGVVFKITPDGTETVLHSFGTVENDGKNPVGSLTLGSDGNFYGVTLWGGAKESGSVFMISPAGSIKVLYSFTGGVDGSFPSGKLIEGSDGKFYGVVNLGGRHGAGAVFSISPSGTESLLYSFGDNANDAQFSFGDDSAGGLTQGLDGNLYGVAQSGGINNLGAVFMITPAGDESVIYSFKGGSTDGSSPVGRLILGNDGNFYGMTKGGGNSSVGTVFKLSSAGAEILLHSFVGGEGDGAHPTGSLIQGNDGNFYGLTSSGGSGKGIAFKITPAGTQTILHSFAAEPRGGDLWSGGLVFGNDGFLYGMTLSGGNRGAGTVFNISTSGDETLLFSFAFGVSDGLNPTGTLIQDIDGNLVGTNMLGGTNNSGNIYKFSPAGEFTVLYSFGPDFTDGFSPSGGLMMAGDGYYYGVTSAGGDANGTAYRITPDGLKTTIHVFGTNGDGSVPEYGLIDANDGFYYGVTTYIPSVYKIAPDGEETVVHLFAGGNTYANVLAGGLTLGSDENLYGMSLHGGVHGAGAIYKIAPDGAKSLVYSFFGFPDDGVQPDGNLVRGNDGLLYGVTSLGGSKGLGTVFMFDTSSGKETVLHSFVGGVGDGASPRAGLIKGFDGNFYGVTYYGGEHDSGTVFRLTPDGTLSLIYVFGVTATDAKYPQSNLLQGSDGNLYGVTANGGDSRSGTLFRISLQ